MRLLLSALVMIIGGLLGVLSYERLMVERSVGPAAIFATAVLGSVFLFMFVTLLLYRTRYWTIMANIWLVAVSVAITYAIVDVIAGVALIERLSPPLVRDEYRHHKLVPNSYSRFQQRDFNYVQRVNNLGMRGKDRALQKPRGTIRILMLGDSFTMGKGVNDDQTFSVLLENSLNRKYAKCLGNTIEVLNAGVDSYAPILSYIQLRRDLYQLEPDVVVLNLDVSDLVQEVAYRRLAAYGTDGDVIGVPQLGQEKASLNKKLRDWTDQHLYVTRLLLFHINRLFDYSDLSVRDVVTQAHYEILAHTLAADSVPRDEEWSYLFDSVLRIKSFSNNEAADFVLSVYPWGHQVSDTEWQPGRLNYMAEGAVVSDRSLDRIRSFAAENNVKLADMFPEFRAYTGGAALYFPYDMHWSPAGHEVMARGLEQYLRETVTSSWCR